MLFFKNGHWPISSDHLCLNKKCINEEHLEEVSHSENMTRRWKHKKGMKHATKIGEAVAGVVS